MSKPDIKAPVLKPIAELENWVDNPRTWTHEDFDRLKGQIQKLGVYKTLLINQNGIVLGGNMRLMALKELGATEAYCVVVDAQTPELMLEYALSDNDQVGVTDDMKLGELFALHPIETKLYKIQSNVLRPLETVINPPDPATLGGDNPDQSDMDESLDTYLHGNVKQIVLYYDNPQYKVVVDQLAAIGKDLGLEDHTTIITKLIGDYHAGIVADQKAN